MDDFEDDMISTKWKCYYCKKEFDEIKDKVVQITDGVVKCPYCHKILVG